MDSRRTEDSCIQKNIIYTTDTDRKMHIIDRKKGKEIQKYSLPECFWEAKPIAVVKNILFGFRHYYDNSIASDGITVVDLNKKRKIGTIPVQFDNDRRTIKNKSQLLKMLITMVREKGVVA